MIEYNSYISQIKEKFPKGNKSPSKEELLSLFSLATEFCTKYQTPDTKRLAVVVVAKMREALSLKKYQAFAPEISIYMKRINIA